VTLRREIGAIVGDCQERVLLIGGISCGTWCRRICHILDHEDAGMMANIAIVPDLNSPGGGLGMSSMNHAASAMKP
jgi:hypothetical protein